MDVARSRAMCIKKEPMSFSSEQQQQQQQQQGPRLLADKDFQCPICIQTMKDAFLTACGHSFCYMCIITHLNNKKNCPCCGVYLTSSQLYPNFLLNKILKKVATSQISCASPTEQLRFALQQGVDVPLKEIDSLLVLLSDKKRKAEHEEAEVNMEVLLEFLQRSRQQKMEELSEIQGDLQSLREDISAVEIQRQELLKSRQTSSLKWRFLLDCPALDCAAQENPYNRPAVPLHRVGQAGAALLGGEQRKATRGPLVKKNGGISNGTSDFEPLPCKTAKKKRMLNQFEDLQDCYLNKRRRDRQMKKLEAIVKKEKDEEGCGGFNQPSGLEDFRSILAGFTRYSRLELVAELRHGDLFHSSNIVSSIEFDRDDELFATAGVSRRIKIFEFATVVNELADVHCPVAEMSTRSKLSCLSWNKYIKGQIASSDYEGTVTVWDVNSCQSVMEYEEHERRAWSVDFSRTDPTMLVSGSDDGKVKLWCTRQETSVLNIDMKANICCVKYNPGSSNFVAVGSADHHIHYYDLRNSKSPLHVFSGHRKAVSYVKFVSPNELASASTDSTLRLWDVQKSSQIRSLTGHANEKNFVGLTVNSEYIACGSETNEVVVYHKEVPKPAARHRFTNHDSEESDDDVFHFISAVCWKSDSPTMLAANSQGTIKVLVLAP
ncbi:E3 ubiquitin-protein ligase COP1 [Selaginella moellendorffii]|nr:E3 ubiquitin-protein ligase COP1 [Selaginella moellendorffii]|eukprot:XP_002970454.2 E3 ubiquitin-protein ligase COP1 [Selaginella moellendorffii]